MKVAEAIPASTCCPLDCIFKGSTTKEFGESSARSTYAAGNADAAKVLEDIQKSPTKAAKVRKAMQIAQQMTTTKRHTQEEALRIFLEANLTKAQ